MKLNLEEMRDIARTLPIGYYLGRKVPVMVEEHDNAYCDVVKGDIHIGIGLLQMAADRIDAKDAAKWNREKLLRCLLYHEIGHLLLTPKWLKTHVAVMRPDGTGYGTRERAHILNIFEDERLESILSEYFMGVDFRAFVELIHKGAKMPSDEVSEVFKAIRLRQTAPEVSAAVDDAVRKLAALTALTDVRDGEPCPTGGHWYLRQKYGIVVSELVKKILDAKAKAQQQSQSSQQQSQSQSSQSSQSQQSQQTGSGTPEDKPEQGESGPDESDKDGEQGKPGKGKPEQGDGTPEEESDKGKADGKPKSGDGESDKGKGKADGEDGETEERDGDSCGETEEAESDSKDDGGGNCANGADDADGTDEEHDDDGESQRKSAKPFPHPGFAPSYLKKLADKVFATPTQDVENTLRKFAQRLAKQKGAQAAGRWSALHGRIDTRRDAMDKERIFRRTADAGDRLNTAVHLVLWVDSSGSFKKSEPILNQILAATHRAAEMSGGRLDVDVVKAYNVADVAPKNAWAIQADWGNDINDTYELAWAATRKRDRRNIDVVVFDGPAACCLYDKSKCGEVFRIVKKIWNYPDCHLIVDNDNYTWAKELNRAHVTYMSSGYAEKLQAEVLKLLDRIL